MFTSPSSLPEEVYCLGNFVQTTDTKLISFSVQSIVYTTEEGDRMRKRGHDSAITESGGSCITTGLLQEGMLRAATESTYYQIERH